MIAPFSDGVLILTTVYNKEDAEAAAQSVVNCVLDWSQEWKLNLNADKHKVYPFQLGLTTAFGNLPSSLATRKFGLTSLHVSSVSFWTEVLCSVRV